MTSPAQRAHMGGKNSTSYQQFSFSKSPRFGSWKSLQYITEFSAPYQSHLSKRGTSLGYGQKQIPGADSITQQAAYRGEFNGSFSSKRGHDFGTPRDKMTNFLPNTFTPDKQHKVGPGMYDGNYKVESRFKKSPSGQSMWNEKRFQAKTLNDAPGPQKYDTNKINMNGSGQFYNSKQASSPSPKISPQHKLAPISRTPGPGNYHLPQAMPTDGKCFESQFSSAAVRTIPHEKRPDIGANPNPGPGRQDPCSNSEFIRKIK